MKPSIMIVLAAALSSSGAFSQELGRTGTATQSLPSPATAPAPTPAMTAAQAAQAMQDALRAATQNGEMPSQKAETPSNNAASTEVSAATQQIQQAMAAAIQNAASMQKPGASSPQTLATSQQIEAALTQIQTSQQDLALRQQAYPGLASDQRTASLQKMTTEIAANDKLFQALGQPQVPQVLKQAPLQTQQSFISSLQSALRQEQALETNMKTLSSSTAAGVLPGQRTPGSRTLALSPADEAALLKQRQAAAAAAAALQTQQQAAAILAARERVQQAHEEALTRAEAAQPKPLPKPALAPASPTAQQALRQLQDSLAKIKDLQGDVASEEKELRSAKSLEKPPLLAAIRTQLSQIDALLLPDMKTGPSVIAASPAAGQAALQKSLQAAIDLQSQLKAAKP